MAISSYKTFLMKGTGTSEITWSKLIDIKDYPDLGGTPEMLETTTLSDGSQTYIPGIFHFGTPVVLSDNGDREGNALLSMIYRNRYENREYIAALCNALAHFLLRNLKTEA